jgi:hypothetical protein
MTKSILSQAKNWNKALSNTLGNSKLDFSPSQNAPLKHAQ